MFPIRPFVLNFQRATTISVGGGSFWRMKKRPNCTTANADVAKTTTTATAMYIAFMRKKL
jgi:hypothetical protein